MKSNLGGVSGSKQKQTGVEWISNSPPFGACLEFGVGGRLGQPGSSLYNLTDNQAQWHNGIRWTTKKAHQAIKLNDTGKLSLCAATHLLSIKIQFRNAATRFLRGGPVGMWQRGPMERVVLDSQNDLSSEMQCHLGVLWRRRRRKDFAAQGPG